jgi:large subunit ribosomal protein L22
MVKYSFQEYDKKTMVRVSGNHVPISLKTTTEVLSFIRGRNVNQAIRLLHEVSEAKRPVPFLKYKKDVPHRKGAGISIGRFPKNVSIALIALLESIIANAKDKGLDETSLTIIHAAAQSGPKLWHYGRKRRRLRKVCHVGIVAKEVKVLNKKGAEEK